MQEPEQNTKEVAIVEPVAAQPTTGSNEHPEQTSNGITKETSLSDIQKNNTEYMLVSRAIEALRSQLERAKNDMDIINDLRTKALANPLGYVESILTNKAPKAPVHQPIAEVPQIQIEPYILCADDDAVENYMSTIRDYSALGGDPNSSARRYPFNASLENASRLLGIRRSMRLASGSNTPRAASTPRARRQASTVPMQSSVAVSRRQSHIPSDPGSRDPGHGKMPELTIGSSRDRSDRRLSAKAVPKQGANGVYQPSTHASSRNGSEPADAAGPEGGGIDGSGGHGLLGLAGGRGRAQKTLTPQMLEEFRRQVSEERTMSAGDVDAGLETDGLGEMAQWDNRRQRGSTAQSMAARGSGKRVGGKEPPKSSSRKRRKGGGGRKSEKTKKGRGAAKRRSDSVNPRSASYNLPWTDEEQQMLEELLIAHPEEEVANNRWRKIAEALGTRTMRQVASRVQKYFIKLAKAGLPVPGRIPDTANWSAASYAINPPASRTPSPHKAAPHRRKPKRKFVEFTSSEGEDDMDESEVVDMSDSGGASRIEPEPAAQDGRVVRADRKGKQADVGAGADGSAADEPGMLEFGFGSEAQATELWHDGFGIDGNAEASSSRGAGAPAASGSEGAEKASAALQSAKAVHLGYRCDSCMAEPIVGIRWHCVDCHGAHTVDLCDECREEGEFESAWHRSTHSFIARRDAEMDPYYAADVASAALQEYSYLA